MFLLRGFLSSLSTCYVFTEGFSQFCEYLPCFYWGVFSVLPSTCYVFTEGFSQFSWVPTMFLLRAFLSFPSTCYVFTEGFSQFLSICNVFAERFSQFSEYLLCFYWGVFSVLWVPVMFLLRAFLSSLSTCHVFAERFSQFSWVSAMFLLRGFLSSVSTTVSVFILVMHCLTCNKKYSCFTTATLINIYFIYSCCLELTINIWTKRNILFLIYLYQTCADRLPFKRPDVEHHMAIC